MKRMTTCFFSPRGTTAAVVKKIGAGLMQSPAEELDLLRRPLAEAKTLGTEELLVVGMPVYAGRLPALCAAQLAKLKGNKTPAVAAVVYGNREYDDALLELVDILTANGFAVVSAGAFIAQHSIFPEVGAGRPDADDEKAIAGFAKATVELLATAPQGGYLAVRGNPSYRQGGGLASIRPDGDKSCTNCGACVKICPTGAISAESPRKTNPDACIGCGACIGACPVKARDYHGLAYQAASKVFKVKCAQYKKPEMFFIK